MHGGNVASFGALEEVHECAPRKLEVLGTD